MTVEVEFPCWNSGLGYWRTYLSSFRWKYVLCGAQWNIYHSQTRYPAFTGHRGRAWTRDRHVWWDSYRLRCSSSSVEADKMQNSLLYTLSFTCGRVLRRWECSSWSYGKLQLNTCIHICPSFLCSRFHGNKHEIEACVKPQWHACSSPTLWSNQPVRWTASDARQND